MIKQTAGHDSLGEFAPKFAELNDDVLFGEVWSREDKLSLKNRSMVTISALIGKGIVDSSLKYHLISAKNNGITKTEMERKQRDEKDRPYRALYSGAVIRQICSGIIF